MKNKLMIALALITVATGFASQPAENKQQPPVEVQKLFNERGQALEKLLSQANTVPALQQSVAQIRSLRKQLDQEAKNGKTQQQNEVSAQFKSLQKQNMQALANLVKRASSVESLKPLVNHINELNKKISEALKKNQANINKQPESSANVRYATIVK